MLNEERLKMFAMMLEVLTAGSPLVEKLKEQGQALDCQQIVRTIAETVPYPNNPLSTQYYPAVLNTPKVFSPAITVFSDSGTSPLKTSLTIQGRQASLAALGEA
jgi:hypothetical protein